jgi:competence protein ComEC
MSHPQSDHMNGLRFIAAHFHAKEFWSNGDRGTARSFGRLMEMIDRKGIRRRLPRDIRRIDRISGVRVTLLHPEEAATGRPNLGLNDNSLVLRLTYGGRSCLFPGDIEEAGETAVLRREGQEIRSDLLLVPHHGSRTSSSKPFLARVRPRLSVISCGRDNPFGFPHRDVLRRLRAAGSRIIRLDRAGATSVSLAPGGWKVRTFIEDGRES